MKSKRLEEWRGGEMVGRDGELKRELMSKGDEGGAGPATLRQDSDTPGTCFFRDEDI